MTIDLENTIEYYINLLIIQYGNKEKARSTIELNIRTLLNNDIYSDVQDAYNIDTAIGVQLDVLGEYIGLDRSGQQVKIAEGLNLFSVLAEDAPQNAEAFGVVSEAQFPLIDSHILGADAGDFESSQLLDDETYRFLLKLRIIQNNINHSEAAINNGIFAIFGNDLIPSAVNGKMIMFYLVESESVGLAEIALQKNTLPRPMGVKIPYLIKNPPVEKFFGFLVKDIAVDGIEGPSVADVGGGRFLSNQDLIFT